MKSTRILEPLLTWLVVVIVLSSTGYHWIVFGAAYSWGSIVETLYFSVQTVTTVGYGNWHPAGALGANGTVFWVKVLSIPTMIAGAALFTAAVAVAVELLGGRAEQ